MFNSFPTPKPDSGGNNIKSKQSGIFTMTATSNTINISSIDITKSIIKVTVSDNALGDPEYSQVQGILTNSTTITLSSIAFQSGNGALVAWEVIEYNDVKSKQTGTFLNSVASTEGVIVVSAININKVQLLTSWSTSVSVGTPGQAVRLLQLRERIISPTSIGFLASTAGQNIAWQLIEFN